MKLVHEIGLELRSSAVCTGLRRIRYGHFTLTHSLLPKHCTAQSIADNVDFCRPLVTDSRHSDTVRTDRHEADLESGKIVRRENFDCELNTAEHQIQDVTTR